MKTKVKLFNSVVYYKNFRDSELPKEGMHCIWLLVTTIDSTLKVHSKAWDDFWQLKAL